MNRGWRFCRFGGKGDVVDSSCFLVRLPSSCCPVFGRYCSQVVPKFEVTGTFYIWKKKYANLGVTELRRLKQLEEENARLKRVVGDLTLDRHILQEVLRKKV